MSDVHVMVHITQYHRLIIPHNVLTLPASGPAPYLLVFLLQTVPVRIGCLCKSSSAHSPSPPDPVPQPVLSRVVSAPVTTVLNADRTESEFPFCLFINTGAEGNDGQYIQCTQCGEGQLKWVSTMLYVPVSYRTQCTKCTQYCEGN